MVRNLLLLKDSGPVRLHKLLPANTACFSGGFAVLSGALALLCWIQKWPGLIQVQGVTMYADIAVFCILAGVGLLMSARPNYAAARIVGLLLALTAKLHLTADLGGFSVSVHRLFPSLAAGILTPQQAAHVQIPPVTAGTFFLFGCALTLLSRRSSNQILAIRAAIGVVITTVSLIVLYGYLKGICGTCGYAVSHMPLLAAICTLLLGISLCTLCSMHARSISGEVSPTPVVIGTIGLIFIFGGIDTATIVKTRAALLSNSDIDEVCSEMRAVQKTVDLLQTAESSKRAFLLTRDNKFLATYMLDVAALRGALESEKLLHIPQWQEGNLHGLITARMAQLDATLELDRQGRRKAAIELIRNGSGALLNDQIETGAKFVMSGLESDAMGRKTARGILMQNLIGIILASYVIAILLAGGTVLLAWFEARQQHAKTLVRASEMEISVHAAGKN